MSADDEYAAFLEKANADVSGGGAAKASHSSAKKNKSIDTEEHEVPAVLKQVDEEYISETDAKWEIVWLKCPGNSELDAQTLSNLTSHPSSSIETLSPSTFDPRNEYSPVIDATATAAGAAKKDVKVFRVELGRSRCEYWVVALKAGERVVGFKAEAVET